MANKDTGIKVNSEVTVDWAELGKHLAHQGSDVQAAFLDGFAKGMKGLGAVAAAYQVHHIAAEVREQYMDGGQPAVSWLFEELAVSL